MLINFSFSNYRCFKDPQSFSMQRPKSAVTHLIKELPLVVDAWRDSAVSTVAGIYGPNAAGKSSLFMALKFVSRFVRNGFRDDYAPDELQEPFTLDVESRHLPSRFAIEFVALDDKRYVYSFDVSQVGVLHEELRVYNGSRPSLLFSRDALENDGEVIEPLAYAYKFGKSFSGPKQIFERSVRTNTLAITVMAASNVACIAAAYDYLANHVRYYSAKAYEAEMADILDSLTADTPHGRVLSSLMGEAGLGLAAIKSEANLDVLKKMDDPDNRFVKMCRSMAEKRVASSHPGASAEGEVPAEDFEEEIQAETQRLLSSLRMNLSHELAFVHQGDGCEGTFSKTQESDGTLATLAFFSVALKAMRTRTTVVVDEIDTSLHPLYVEELVKLFCDPVTNPCQSQLIFTTHDVSLITKAGADDRVLERDQTWYVEKDAKGASTLFSENMVPGRREENSGRNYLHDVYGATPKAFFHSGFAKALDLLCEDSQEASDAMRDRKEGE